MSNKTQRQPSTRFSRVIRDPSRIANAIRFHFIRTFGTKAYAAEAQARTRSDNGLYVAFVERAAADFAAFKNFRRHPSYRCILEHLTEVEGADYLDVITEIAPDLVGRINEFRLNDRVGNPYVYEYPGVGTLSPTTLRYVKNVADLRRLFGDNIGENIAEVGVGYGGLLRIIDSVFHFKQYTMFDLAPVLDLTTRYLENYVLNGSYCTTTLNQHSGDSEFDLAISNYAFSEFPIRLQEAYVKKVFAKSRRGFLTMNTGLGKGAVGKNKLDVATLRGLLPAFEVLEERPRTDENNYIIAWGHK